jgi:hypothetical protein
MISITARVVGTGLGILRRDQGGDGAWGCGVLLEVAGQSASV